jgi:hypothetical protein
MAQEYSKGAQGATQPSDRQTRSSASIVRIRPIDPPSISATDMDERAIAHIAPYIDTVELTYPRRPKGLLAEARNILGRKVWFRDIVDGSGNRWGSRLPLNQPTPELLPALDKYGGSISRIDIAFDIFPLDMSVELMASVIRANTFLRWRRPQPMFDYFGTLYWGQQHKGEKRPDRNLAEYHDLPSKLTGQRAVHLELRLQTSDATKAEKFRLPSDLGNINPRELFDKHIRIIDFQHHVSSDIMDGDHSNRTRGFYRRFYGNRVQHFKDAQPRTAKRLETLNSRFNLGDRLTWAATSGTKDHLTWVSLASPSNHPSSVLITHSSQSWD